VKAQSGSASKIGGPMSIVAPHVAVAVAAVEDVILGLVLVFRGTEKMTVPVPLLPDPPPLGEDGPSHPGVLSLVL